MTEESGVEGLASETKFGQRKPPLTELIKNILNRYPDGGQILKELIQNADDAGATEVRFLYDYRSFDTQYLDFPDLEKFQGPAFYAYNNAKFKPEDWEGIQNLMKSNKKNDPLKVGQFGIGFNSVYHITDLPGIVSGDTIGFLDPHELHFGPRQSGKQYKISDRSLNTSSRDQFEPFQGIYNCDLSQGKSYDSTLFRFPLRTEPSELSEKTYTKEMIDGLFESLREEASVILLFLKSVQSISVDERREDGSIECVFMVEVAEETREDVREERQRLLDNALDPNVPITQSKYLIDVRVTSGLETTNHRWFVLNQIGSVEEHVTTLATKLCLLPWVGCAIPLSGEAIGESGGRIFCFLPLPPDVDCKTGLPVHLHGYFGVTDNRRGLVWPGSDCQNNETAEWNELLVKKVGTAVYGKILEALIKDEPRTGLTEEQRCQLVYSVLPDLNKVRGHWRCILEPLFEEVLIDQKLFYCQSSSGSSWITLKEGILDRLEKSATSLEARNTILRTLVDNGLVIITDLPKHVKESVDEYFGKQQVINPARVRDVLKNPAAKELPSRKEKMLLLDYVLSDSPIDDLSGVPLLLLEGGEFTTFRSHSHASDPSGSVFVPSGNCTAALLPNMSTRFLDKSLSDETARKLYAMAAIEITKQNSTQLVKLTKDIVVENLHASLPPKWSRVIRNGRVDKVEWTPNYFKHPSQKWLEDIWRWIHDSYPDSLEQFRKIPLIPLPTTTTNRWLGILSQDSKFIFASDSSGDKLPPVVIGLLTGSGCTVVSEPPPYLCHPDIHSYIASSTPAGTMTVLTRASLKTVQEYIKQTLTSDNRASLRKFLSRLPKCLSPAQEKFLLQLPLFDTLIGFSTAVQVNGGLLQAASSEFSPPNGFQLARSDQIVSSVDPNACQLLNLLNVKILKPAEVFLLYLFPDIQAKTAVYDAEQTSGIMFWILEQMFTLKTQCVGFHEHVKILSFVPPDKGKLKKPSELYDPNDALLVDLFLGETTKFPTGDFANENVVPELKELGLRKRDMLTATELLEVAVNITSDPVSLTYISKAEALVKILEDNPVYLNQCVDEGVTLKDKLLHLTWLPCAKYPPRDTRFPEFMPWYDSNSSFFSPTELRSKSQVLLVGSSMPILDTEMSEELQDKLGLTSDPPLHQVVSQLEIAVQSWQEQHQKKGSSQLEEMLVAIYLHLSQIPNENVSAAINNAALKHWIWQGAGFCSPPQLALEQRFPGLDLRPQFFLLPEVLNDIPSLKQFLLSQGVRERFNEEDILGVLDDLKNKHEKLPPKVNASSEVENDLKLCRSILEWVVKDGETLEESLQEKVLVPVQNARDGLVLEPCKKCTFCDQNWLRCGGSELDIPDDYSLIHESVPVKVARLLGVPALSTCLVSAETLGFEFEQTGPHEPITTRLNNILKEYKEGVGVFKELIQNADDAGASKVRFLVDWRHGPKQKLLSPKMAECQGPALWAYNNAVFTDKDFENINKLAGATKVEDLAKVGRFGLGFNAVYHLTDVPSFVSREYFVMFDPNVHHLQSHIKDKSRPGIRINLAVNARPLSAFEDQFQPYHDIFECDTQCTEGEKFNCNGTLFRFPFRTLRQASESEICQSVYNEEKVKEIVSSLKESASLLLLYTQHVNDVELYELEEGNNPNMMQLVLSIKKNVPQDMRSGASSAVVPFIQECSDWWKGQVTSKGSVGASPRRLERLTIDVSEMASDVVGTTKKSVQREAWLVSSCGGTGSSTRLALNEGRDHGLLPCAGAAAKLSNISGNKSMNAYMIPEAVSGEAFCFLPLSIATGFPAHINGYFAITSNRRGIWERNKADHSIPIEVQWNESLMEDALARAYLQLLEEVKRLSGEEYLQYDLHQKLWPCYDKMQSNTWGTLVKSFYTKLVEEGLRLFWSNGQWLDIHSGYVLDDKLSEVPGVRETFVFLKEDVFHLTQQVRNSFIRSGQEETLQNRTLTPGNFLEEFFFPNITAIPQNLRDPIVCFALDCILRGQKEFEALFQENACITCSEDRVQLAKACELISPNGAAAGLFSVEDNRFPVGEGFLINNRLCVLEQLGMVKDELSWNDICERAKSVEICAEANYEKGRERGKNLIKYLTDNIEKLEEKQKADHATLEILQTTRFLPFIWKPPQEYTLPWEGSQHAANQLFTATDLFLPRDEKLIGSCCLIVNDSDESGCGRLGKKVKALLGFRERRPGNDQVLQQLDFAINEAANRSQAESNESLTGSVCKMVYKHLNAFVMKEASEGPDVEKLLQELRGKPWLYIQGRFVSSNIVAFDWKENGAPYLYGLPNDHEYRKYKSLLDAAGVKESFEAMDFINALNILKESKGGTILDEDEIKMTVSFVSELHKGINEDDVCEIPLPDSNGVLHRSKELTIKEPFWLQDRRDARYVHKSIPPQLALDLGAKLLLDRRRDKYSSPLSKAFGQHEELTDRLKNILKSYPCDSGILKELVQNADDAKATEIHFVHDNRVLPHERVVQHHAEEIQGPALCVYNNRPFSDHDLEGIQKLGVGSKSDNPEKIGQYGIGFNAVYHLTDCPSFLSNGDTLCLLDPHCHYAAGATSESPGEMFQPIDDEFKEDFSHSLCGYDLGEHFPLKGATVFRLPLRTDGQTHDYRISKVDVKPSVIRELLDVFKTEAKKMLLFLNYVKKISLSVIDCQGQFNEEYWVESRVEEESEKKRVEMASLIKEYKDQPTNEIPRREATYFMTLSDSKKVVEEWLIHQCCGATCEVGNGDNTIPDGRSLGLFPRGGVAALVSHDSPPFTPTVQHQYVAYCFLPLPTVNTLLPVHVNGHFALNPSRRDLWKDDPHYSGPLTKWNDFVKSRVIAPGYAALITEARNYIPHCIHIDRNNQYYFQNRKDAEAGLKWYHDIFPDPFRNPAWNILAIEVYRCLGSKEAPVLPVVVFDEERGLVKTDVQVRKSNTRAQAKKRRSSGHVAHSKIQTTANEARMIPQSSETRSKYAVSPSLPYKIRESARVLQTTCSKAERFSELSRRRLGTSSEALARIYKWLPAHQVFFTDTDKLNHFLDLFSVLLRVDMPLLLYSPRLIHDAFIKAGVFEQSRFVRPASVIEFLRTSQVDNPKCKIGDLPKALEDTNIRSISDLHRLISYCKEEKTFSALLQGLPLLLTADGQLRVFDSDKPVYCSSFSDLFPAKHDRFVHPELVAQLLDVLRRENDDEPLPPVMLDLTVRSLASFLILPDVFPPELIGCTCHVSLEFRKDGVLSETWFKRLWEFLENYAKPEPNEASLSLEPLRELPIIPTVCGKLVTIGNAKSVLDMSKRVAEYEFVEKIREILKRLDCPILRVEITKSFLVKPELSIRSFVLDTYVAHPQSAVDILHVLEYMNTTRILDAAKLSAEDICVLMVYFQNGVRDTCLINILKALPFYKAIDGSHHALSEYIFYVTVPCGIPTTEMSMLQNKEGKRCFFLHPDGSLLLAGLYKMLGVETTCTVWEFYKKYVLPHFYIFSREFQIECLTHIKDWLWKLRTSSHEFFAFLRSIACIPDKGGKLHRASDFYHPKNKVFQIMLDPNRNHFLSAPFDQHAWLKFLVKIGFNENVSEEKYLEFCRTVARNAQATSKDDEINRERSEVLVQYMFDNEHLYKPDFFKSVSNIQFISPEKVEPDLLSVHQQHQYDEANEKLQYIKFRNSVLWTHRKLVWTSAQLLPLRAQPRNLFSGAADTEHLGVQEKPPIEIVITHLKTISNAYAEVRKKAGVLPSLGKLKEVMASIYDFLDQSQGCVGTELSNSCSSACQTIGSRLKSVPCVFLEDENVLVEGEKLSFTFPSERSLKPFFYTVPREYGAYQHLLKRLGATEEVTSLQMANVLQALKDRCEDSKMCSDHEKIAGDAMFLLFQCVTTAEEKKASKISTLEELYLPSEAQILFKSNELVCNVPPHLVQSIARQKYNVLLPLEKCGLERIRESEYLEAIPQHLRPKSLDHLVLEVLDPACHDKRCLYLDKNCCTFIENYIVLLKSTQFRYGLVRLMKHQKKLNELSNEEKEKAARFSSDKVKIECMKTIKTHLVYVKDQTPLGQNSGERTCYVTRESDSWTLYIQHEFGGKHTKAILSKAVKEILEGCVEDTSELADMLSCEMPSQIPGVLDAHDVSRDFSEDDDDLGREISAVYRYLMVQNPMCLFDEGARVAYEEDTSGDVSGVDTSGDDTRRYILARIIKRVGNLGKAGQTYDFQAEYCIDVGSDTKTVSVLDLYKFQEDDLVNSAEARELNASVGPSIDVEKEKRQIREALREANLLPLQKRLKVFRRLYLHWIRAKNSGKDEVATTEIIEFLSSEAEKIENEMDTTDGPTWPRFFHRRYWMNWESQATREKEVFDNFRSSYTGYGSGSYTETLDYFCPEPAEASRWIEQSQADLEAAGCLQSNIPPFYALVCFMSEQVAEKCLKAALYAKCGLRREQLHTHDVYGLASSVCSLSDSPKDVVSRASGVVATYYLPTRYPNRQPSFKVPANEYSKEEAGKALEAVNELLKSIKTFVDG